MPALLLCVFVGGCDYGWVLESERFPTDPIEIMIMVCAREGRVLGSIQFGSALVGWVGRGPESECAREMSPLRDLPRTPLVGNCDLFTPQKFFFRFSAQPLVGSLVIWYCKAGR